MKAKKLPPLELILHRLEIDYSSPSGLSWKNPIARCLKPGDPAGNLNHSGYWQVTITTDKRRKYMAHRIIYYIQTGEDPGENCIDHADGKKSTNEENIRIASREENSANRAKPSHRKGKKTSSKYKGVYWNKAAKKWRASITVSGKNINLGFFMDEKEAAKSYNKAAFEAWGEFAKLNDVD
jgi:hypothetical protein